MLKKLSEISYITMGQSPSSKYYNNKDNALIMTLFFREETNEEKWITIQRFKKYM